MVMRIAIVVGCGLLVTACGGSSPGKPNASRVAGRTSGVAFSECMRSHGVPNFPDPTSNGAIRISPSSGVNPAAPAFQAAQTSCSKLLPGGGPGSGRPDPQAKAHLLQVSACMRAHGVPDFPDPHSGPPPTNLAGYSGVMATNGFYLAIPSSINVRAPAFLQAAAACNFGPRGGGGPLAKG
jgi:hypothetical protein